MSRSEYPQTLTLLTQPVTPVQLALFAAASGDHNPLHLDPATAQRAGFERPVVHGMLSMAVVGRMFSDRFGPGCLRMLHTRFTGVALAGDRLDVSASLERVADDEAHYTLRATTPAGSEVLTGAARVRA